MKNTPAYFTMVLLQQKCFITLGQYLATIFVSIDLNHKTFTVVINAAPK
jgi:hypothetical protein